MSISRRDFLTALITTAPAALIAPAGYSRSSTSRPLPVTTNYSASGRAVITEGKTLLVSITLPSRVDQLGGEFPVEIAPSSANGARLIEKQPLYFYPAGEGRTFRTILSAPLDSVEGIEPRLRLTASEQGAVSEWSIPYHIERGVYRNSSLTLSRDFSAPPPEVAARMRRDFETMVEIYKRRTPRRWQAPFLLPVTSPSRGNFGDRRVVNATKRYRHGGLDFLAPIGTPVRAINDGTVALSDQQWTPGQTVCIDHGGGVFSKYMHLSERRVGEGETVRRGQVIALSGASGGQRPGPHLHLDLVVNGAHVDPMDFLRTAARLVALESSGDYADR